MDYFKKFPKAFYSIDNFQTMTYVTNIVARFKFFDEVLQNRSAFYPYVIPDGERADTIADKYYGDSKYAWVINSFNQYIDPLWQWPLSDIEFQAYITREYGSVAEAESDIEFYYKTINDREYVVNSTDSYDRTETAYQFEQRINEDRRNIKLLDPRYLSKLEKELKALFADA